MQQRIVEIASDSVHLSAHRGFMKIEQGGNEIGRVAFADIGAVIVRGHGSTLSVNLCVHLSEAGARYRFGLTGSPCLLLNYVWGRQSRLIYR